MRPVDAAAEARAAETIAWFAEGWRDPGDGRFCEHFLARMHQEVRLVQPLVATGVGHGAFRAQFARLFATIPDLHARVLRWSFQEQDIFIELALEGTIGRRPVRWQACDRLTVRDGLIIERRSFFDPAPLVKAIVTRPGAWPRLLASTARAARYPTHAPGPQPSTKIEAHPPGTSGDRRPISRYLRRLRRRCR